MQRKRRHDYSMCRHEAMLAHMSQRPKQGDVEERVPRFLHLSQVQIHPAGMAELLRQQEAPPSNKDCQESAT